MSRKINFPNYIPLMEFVNLPSKFVAIMGHSHKNRGMILSEYNTRCIRKEEIHELVLLKEEKDGQVNFKDAYYLGFIEFRSGGVLAKGMTIEIQGKIIGRLVGFDITHEPNHYNLLVSTPNPIIGTELGIKLNEDCLFSMKKQ